MLLLLLLCDDIRHASVTGAAAAVAAGRHRKLSTAAKVCGVALGIIAPWLFTLPFWLAILFPVLYNGNVLELATYSVPCGLLVVFIAYLVFFILLKTPSPHRNGNALHRVVHSGRIP